MAKPTHGQFSYKSIASIFFLFALVSCLVIGCDDANTHTTHYELVVSAPSHQEIVDEIGQPIEAAAKKLGAIVFVDEQVNETSYLIESDKGTIFKMLFDKEGKFIGIEESI